jgi:hypothetical protein
VLAARLLPEGPEKRLLCAEEPRVVLVLSRLRISRDRERADRTIVNAKIGAS